MGVFGIENASTRYRIWKYSVHGMVVLTKNCGSILHQLWEYLVWNMGLLDTEYGSNWYGVWAHLLRDV